MRLRARWDPFGFEEQVKLAALQKETAKTQRQ